MRTLLALLVSGLFVIGCAPLKQYHPGSSGLQSYESDSLAEAAPASCPPGTGTSAGFDFGFVEFDENGNPFDQRSVDRLMASIQAKDDAKPLLIVTYAHGWRHSAEDSDHDVREFKLAMRNIAAMDQCHRQVVGVYLGWRGQVYAANTPLDLITFWDRKQTAHDVGDGAVREVLLRLDKERVRRNNGSLLQARSHAQTRLVFVGHSFGGAILYTALAPTLVERFIQTDGFDQGGDSQPGMHGCPKGQPLSPIKTVGDLVVLVNPAFEAMRFSTLHKLSMDCSRYAEGQAPIIAVLTGNSDWATGVTFPAARFLRNLFSTYSDELPDEGFVADSKAIGHYKPYLTHTLALTPETVQKPPTSFAGCEDYIDPTKARTKRLDNPFIFTRLQGSEGNPVLNIEVDKPIIEGHGGIYSCQLMLFLGRLIAQEDYLPELERSAAAPLKRGQP